MPEFRKWFIALAIVALCVGVVSAQTAPPSGGTGVGAATGTAANTQATCSIGNGAVTPVVRSEGYTELTGDIVITCTGGQLYSLGTQIPVVNILIFYSNNVTSRLLQLTTVGNASEALLLIDEPRSGLVGYGPAQGEYLCGTPLVGAGATGCTQWVGQVGPSAPDNPAPNSTVNGTWAGVPVASNPNNGSGVYVAQNLSPGANVFQGVVSSSTVSFFGIPAMPPATQGLSRVFRITNIRVNAAGIAGGSSSVIPITASISTNGASSLPIGSAQLIVGFTEPSLTTAARNAQNTSSGGGSFNQCSSASTSTTAGSLQYTENFANAFKTQCGGQCSTGSIPGTIYYSESGFVLAQNVFTNTGLGIFEYPGLADYGSRLRANFSNVPSGVSIFVSTVDIQNNYVLATGGTHAELVVGAATSDLALGGVPAATQTAVFGGQQNIPYAPVTITNGSGEAVWEIINTNPNTIVTYQFAVYVSYTASPANNTPAAPSSMQVTMGYAPTPLDGLFTSSTGAAASNSLTIPRFSNVYDHTVTLASFVLCQTDLLYPYAVNAAGFDTGLAIANTTSDPFGTTAQVGTCQLNFYGTAAPATPFNTPSIANGTVWTGLVSAIASGFQGYIIAVCNFQYAHGYSFVSDVGVRNFAAAYLALIMNAGSSLTTRGTSGENLNN